MLQFYKFELGEEFMQDSVKREIVLDIARKLFVASLKHEENHQIGVANPETCLDAAEMWAEAQIEYCKQHPDEYFEKLA